MNLRAWIDTYLDYLRAERGLAKNTLDAYALDLGALAEHLGEDRDPSGIQPDELSSLLASHHARGLSAPSSARQLSAVRGLFRFLARVHVVAQDPTLALATPKLPPRSKKPRAVLSVEQVARLLAAPDRTTDQGACHAAMLQLMYASGLRVSELCGLRLSDFDPERRLVSVRGTGGRHRLVPVGRVAARHVAHYLNRVRPARGPNGTLQKALFPSPRGGHYTREGFWKIVQRCAVAAGIKPLPSPHEMRRAFAAHLLERGADVRAVQALLGHAPRATPAIYTHVARDRVGAAADKSQPHAR